MNPRPAAGFALRIYYAWCINLCSSLGRKTITIR
jgi:hypothetical protein